MKSPKRREIVSLVFTCLCITKSLLILPSWLRKTRLAPRFSTHFSMFGYLMKHSSLYLIYYMKEISFTCPTFQKALPFFIGYQSFRTHGLFVPRRFVPRLRRLGTKDPWVRNDWIPSSSGCCKLLKHANNLSYPDEERWCLSKCWTKRYSHFFHCLISLAFDHL